MVEKLKAETFAYASIPLALLLWFVSFWWRPLNFWIDMGFSTLLMLTLSLYFGRGTYNFKPIPRLVAMGILSAIILYLVFVAGNYAAQVLPTGRIEINEIYSLRIPDQPYLQGILLVFPIAVGEEVYWRGLLQNQLSLKMGTAKGLILSAALYGAVHLWSRSFTLVVAAFIAGLWWGLIFNRTRNITTTIISHSLWSLLIFLLLPVT